MIKINKNNKINQTSKLKQNAKIMTKSENHIKEDVNKLYDNNVTLKVNNIQKKIIKDKPLSL